MELLRQAVRALAHDQPAVARPVGQQVDQPLQAAEARLLRVLVLVRPGLVGLHVGAVGEGHVDGVEGDDEVGRVVDALEGGDEPGLLADGPGEGLVRDAVAEAHALLGDDGQVGFFDGGGVVAVEAEAAGAGGVVSGGKEVGEGKGERGLQGLEVGHHVVGVLVCALAGDGALDDDVAVADEVIAEVAVRDAFFGEELVGPGGLGDDGGCGGG